MSVLPRPLVWMLACCCVALVACGARGASGPESFVQQFYATIASGQTEAALDMISHADTRAEELSAARDKATLLVSATHATISNAGGLDSVQIDEVYQTVGNHAKVTLTLRLTNGTQQQEIRKLVRKHRIWKTYL